MGHFVRGGTALLRSQEGAPVRSKADEIIRCLVAEGGAPRKGVDSGNTVGRILDGLGF